MFSKSGLLKALVGPKFLIGIKYYSKLNEARKISLQLVENYYSRLEYEGKEEELSIFRIFLKKSRAVVPLILQTLSIFDANLTYNATPLIEDVEMGSYQGIIYGKGSLGDKFHDGHYVRYLGERRGWNVEKVNSSLQNKEFMLKLGKLQTPYYDEEFGRKIHPYHIINLSFNLGEIYREGIGNRFPSTLQAHEEYEKEVWRKQAVDVAIGALLRGNRRRKILKIVEEELDNDPAKLTDKLGLISEFSIKEVNPLAGHGNEKHPPEETTPPLCKYFGSITRACQIGIDDVGRIEQDIEDKTGNVLIISMLQEYSEVNLKNFKSYVRKKKNILSSFLLPPLKKSIDGLKELKYLNFGYEDARLSFDWMLGKMRKKSSEFCEKFGIEDKWYYEIKKLIEEELES